MVMKFSHSFPQNGKIMLKFVFLDIGHKRVQWLKTEKRATKIMQNSIDEIYAENYEEENNIKNATRPINFA